MSTETSDSRQIRPRGRWLSVRTLLQVTVLSVLTLSAAASAPTYVSGLEALFGYHNYPDEFAAAADTLDRSSPEVDAQAALSHGDVQLVAICEGYAGCPVPGGNANRQVEAIRVVPSIGGCVGRPGDERFRVAAYAYAKRYNATIQKGKAR
jgi:hypothetical protein